MGLAETRLYSGSGDFRAGQASTDDTWLNCALRQSSAYLPGKKCASQRNLGLRSSKGVVLLGFACCSGAVPAWCLRSDLHRALMTDMVGRENLTQLKESLQTDVYNIDRDQYDYSKGGRHRIHNPFPLIIPGVQNEQGIIGVFSISGGRDYPRDASLLCRSVRSSMIFLPPGLFQLFGWQGMLLISRISCFLESIRHKWWYNLQ